MWIDSHCHLDAPEFDPDRDAVLAAARAAGVGQMVLPAVAAAHFEPLQGLARAHGLAYALGIHPLFVGEAADEDLGRLQQALAQAAGDPLLVAVGEIGLDHFVAGLERQRQQHFLRAQLRLASKAGLPVILHTRRALDEVLAALRRQPLCGGIAHAFNGSAQQAAQLLALGFKLGFGGAMSFERARHLRELARTLPDEALVLETDAPDIPPHWLYRSAADRAGGATSRNTPAELPRIGAVLAELRGWTLEETARITRANTLAALPRLAACLPADG
ncbi:MAG TPA: TatD family hydrolase [Rubrivivax sp.]|nr:TatD family hydrolase [Rubrivivax sp.]